MAKQMQMRRVEAAVLQVVCWGQLESGFYRRRGDEGKVWLAGPSGRVIYSFPVLESGEVSKHSYPPEELYPGEEVDVLDPASLGIASLKWSDDEAA